MSVIIIGGGGKAAIKYLQDACARGELNHNEVQQANAHIKAIIALAKIKGYKPEDDE